MYACVFVYACHMYVREKYIGATRVGVINSCGAAHVGVRHWTQKNFSSGRSVNALNHQVISLATKNIYFNYLIN